MVRKMKYIIISILTIVTTCVGDFEIVMMKKSVMQIMFK